MIKAAINYLFRKWYRYISTHDKGGEVIFMNLGFSRDHQRIELSEEDEKNRYSAQLYDHLANRIILADKEILEVGSGRGGGLDYVCRYLSPRSGVGVDLCKEAVAFCNHRYERAGISFFEGDAARLPFEADRFDAVLNVESSHRYADMNRFVSEVYRVLKKDGFFLFADFRERKELAQLDSHFENSGFQIVEKEVITKDVVEALKLSSEQREQLIHRLVPKILQGVAREFACTEGTHSFKMFASGELEYLVYVLKK